jgi:hypothetical protein
MFLNKLSPLILISYAALAVSCEGPVIHENYRLSKNFRGWIMVKYGFKGCPPLKKPAPFTVEFDIPPNGVFCTSDGPDDGFAELKGKKAAFSVKTNFFLGSDQSPLLQTISGVAGGMVWSGGQGYLGDNPPHGSYETFFIGTEAEYLAVVNDPVKGREAFIRKHW